MPAADSGDIRIGGPEKYPLRTVVRPQTISSQLPLGIAPLGLVSFARSDNDDDDDNDDSIKYIYS
jgi:hypothetical protein